MAAEDKTKRKTWTLAETKGLLKCYNARKEEFLHTRKKRNAYTHVLEDIIAQGFTDEKTTTLALEGKMRTLLTAFKCAKDNAGRTGASPCIAPYMEEMEEIFGNSALVANANTLNLGICRTQPLSTIFYCTSPTPLDMPASSTSSPQPVSYQCTTPVPQQLPISPCPTPSPCPQESTPSPHIVNSSRPPPSPQDEHSQVPSQLPSPQPRGSTRRRKTAREKYYEEKLKIKEKHLEEKRKFYNSALELIKECEMKKIEILKSRENNFTT